MDDVSLNSDCFPKSYWANTSSNSIMRKLTERADDGQHLELHVFTGYFCKVGKRMDDNDIRLITLRLLVMGRFSLNLSGPNAPKLCCVANF